jgi:hypothetical protein
MVLILAIRAGGNWCVLTKRHRFLLFIERSSQGLFYVQMYVYVYIGVVFMLVHAGACHC